MWRAALALLVALSLSGPAAAGPLEDGVAAYLTGNYATAVSLWKPLAEQGDVRAQFSLGNMHLDGEGVPQDDAEAARWFRMAAAQGDANAQNILGIMYARGYGVPQDYAAAVRWWRMAAERGYAGPQSNVAVSYYNGEGVPQDYIQAHM